MGIAIQLYHDVHLVEYYWADCTILRSDDQVYNWKFIQPQILIVKPVYWRNLPKISNKKTLKILDLCTFLINLDSPWLHLFRIYGVFSNSIFVHRKTIKFPACAYFVILLYFVARCWSNKPGTLLEHMTYDVLSVHHVLNRVDVRMRTLWPCLCYQSCCVIKSTHQGLHCCVYTFDL